MTKFSIVGIMIVIIIISCKKDLTSSDIYTEKGELIVSFKTAVSAEAVQRLATSINGSVKEVVYTKAMERFKEAPLYIIAVSNDLRAALENLQNHPMILFAEENSLMQISADEASAGSMAFSSNNRSLSSRTTTTGDPLVSVQWNMHGPGPFAEGSSYPLERYGSNASAAWSHGYTGSSSVVVGLIGGGIDIQHPDIQENIWINPGESGGGKEINGIDDDGNGYIDDVHGWDFYHNDNTLLDGSDWPRWTEIAGVIGAKGDNGIGIAGINWDIKMIPVKFVDGMSGTITDFTKAIDYLTDLHLRGSAKITAMNIGWSTDKSIRSFESAVKRANDAGILMICHVPGYSQNVDLKSFHIYPAKYTYPSIIVAAQQNQNGNLVGAYGKVSVDLVAIGQPKFVSTGLKGSYTENSMFGNGHVTGACALYAAKWQTLNPTAAQIKKAILTAATESPTATPSSTVTGGRLNIQLALDKSPSN